MTIHFSDQKEIEKIIADLDTLLARGFNAYKTIGSDYDEQKKKDGFDEEAYCKVNTEVAKEWNDSVFETLKRLPYQHYLFRFVHPRTPAGIMIVGLPEKVSNTKIHVECQLYALEEIILRLEEHAALLIRKEIADKEYQADILYKITYIEHTREVKLNKITLATLKFDSKAVNFIEFVCSHPNTLIPVGDIEDSTALSLSANIHDILRDLGFKGDLRKIFFPVATKAKVMFVNPITKQYAFKNELPAISFQKIGETQRDRTRQDEK